MSNPGRKLYQLQALDLELREQLSRLREKESLLGETAEFRAAKASVDEGERDLAARKSAAKELEYELARTTDKLKSTEARLYGGGISNPKELNSLQQEHEYLQRTRERYEDELLHAMAALEGAEAELAARSKHLGQVREAWQSSQSAVTGQAQELRARVAELKAQRGGLTVDIDAASLSLYEDLARKKGGRAVALLVKQTCQGCRVTLPSGKAQEARKSAVLVLCTNCGRILVAE
ncbi:MAG TPA: C4-type zinc ribbon domain-containing protein [Anaerolineae bacterium]|nr:C4-type zinc ribbon domain-containing protein [Anaerolineae bacterium]